VGKITHERHLYIGHFSSKMAASDYKGKISNLGDQIRLNINTPTVLGLVCFLAKHFMNVFCFPNWIEPHCFVFWKSSSNNYVMNMWIINIFIETSNYSFS